MVDVEFRGPLTRIYGELENQEPICVDLASEQVSGMRLKPDDSIYFQIPKNGFIKYPNSEVRENGIA